MKLTSEQEAIKQAVEAGYQPPVMNWETSPTKELWVKAILQDPAFWQALGKARGWGKWEKTLNEVEHDWELTYYLADTAKTPVHECKKCAARKILDVIEYEHEWEWFEIKEGHWTERAMLNRHSRYFEPWNKHALRYFETLLSGGDMKAFWESLP